MGADFIEISLDTPWPDALDASDILQASEDAGIDVGLHGPWRNQSLAHPEPELAQAARNVMQKSIAFAHATKAAYVVTHVDARDFSRYPEQGPVLEGLERARASLAALRSGMEGTQLIVENTSSPMGTPKEIERFLEPVDDVGFCFDPGHAALVEAASVEGATSRVEDWSHRLGDRWELVHLMDWTQEEDEIVDHLIPGAGDGPVERIVRQAQEHGCTRVMIEAFYTDATRNEANMEDLQKAVERIQQWV